MRTIADILADKGREAYWIDPLASGFDALQMMHDHNEVIRVTTTDTVHHCIDLMREHRFRHLPVVEEGKVLGILSLRDLFLEAIERATDSAPPVRQAG